MDVEDNEICNQSNNIFYIMHNANSSKIAHRFVL